IKIIGVQTTEARTSIDGTFSVKLLPGRYELTLLPDGYLARAATAVVNADEATAIIVQTAPRPAVPGVLLDGSTLKPTHPITLDEKRVEPSAADLQTLGEIADLVARDPSK